MKFIWETGYRRLSGRHAAPACVLAFVYFVGTAIGLVIAVDRAFAERSQQDRSDLSLKGNSLLAPTPSPSSSPTPCIRTALQEDFESSTLGAFSSVVIPIAAP